MKRNHYLNNSLLIEQLHLSKLSVCILDGTVDDTDYDLMVQHDDQTPLNELLDLGRQSRIARRAKQLQALADDLHVKVAIEAQPNTLPADQIVLRRYLRPPPKGHHPLMPHFVHQRGHNGHPVLMVPADPPAPLMTDRLGRALMLLTQRIGQRGNWRAYSYNDEFQADAIMNLVRAIYRFNESKSDNVFAYATASIHNTFLRRLKLERTQHEIRDDLLEMAGMAPSHTRQGRGDVDAS